MSWKLSANRNSNASCHTHRRNNCALVFASTQSTLQWDFANPPQAWRPSGTGVVFESKMGGPEGRWSLTLMNREFLLSNGDEVCSENNPSDRLTYCPQPKTRPHKRISLCSHEAPRDRFSSVPARPHCFLAAIRSLDGYQLPGISNARRSS